MAPIKRSASRVAKETENLNTVSGTKRQKTAAAEETLRLHAKLFAQAARQATPDLTCSIPARQHAHTYHRPLLLNSRGGRDAQESLLSWFDGVSEVRSMPWRQKWIDPSTVKEASELRPLLERRAYQVWISEIMLQQTRVAVVIDYWNRWMEKWPTIQDLAAASGDDVLAAWKGLGYYSRATRIHEAAKKVVVDAEMKGLLPEDAKSLEAQVPGVGRYTAGAISSIVFGRPEPMVDGNVLRVLSRQLGLMGNVKTNRTVIDVLWAAADALVKDVARSTPKSDRPGRWGQGLMELGSTVCTPSPNCSVCPITTTCRAYQEGKGPGAEPLADIEDLCTWCEALPEDAEKPTEKPAKPAKQATLAAFAFTSRTTKSPQTQGTSSSPTQEAITNHTKRFPVKFIKKAVREEETVVCVIRRADGQYLVHRRPEKGLLAGLWEFPSQAVDGQVTKQKQQRTRVAKSFVSSLIKDDSGFKHKGEVGSVPWLFSHIKLTMHVHVFESESPQVELSGTSRWSQDPEAESMGTGMNKCWLLVKSMDQD
ncbi:A/G-specific adenine glycosylase [Geosmithia morbida]|uniref:Adenine DNA glycosylase n=1 Tax=Geosmithia morbida TaxID=1094350 RepID=A0A9P4YQY6_9HYPO|nr:A/G-specific adenine glycosylase [Geosmithia morbida]KAF4119414.1 A/G-specific adenine glycosylase [Geosmithia morbida]